MQAVVEARVAFDDAMLTAAAVAQRARSLTSALEVALESLAVAEADPAKKLQLPAAGRGMERSGALSRREGEVLALVAKGLSNKAIAEMLFVSPNTIKTHVASLLHKFDVDSRVQLAMIATRCLPSPPDALSRLDG